MNTQMNEDSRAKKPRAYEEVVWGREIVMGKIGTVDRTRI